MVDEQLEFKADNNEPVKLLVNPETITLQWKKVINRLRTKTRLVTLFWGEEPVRFTYNGQTGYTFPKMDKIDEKLNNYNKTIDDEISEVEKLIKQYKAEILSGGPYTFGSLELNRNAITTLSNVNYNAKILPRTGLSSKLPKVFNHTEILYLSKNFLVLKKIEDLYRKHQGSSDKLIDIKYRDYIFSGYFESFSFTDDAKNPWNWLYSIDFTVLHWELDKTRNLIEGGEITFTNERDLGVNVKTTRTNLL